MTIDAFDVIELNEAFAAQGLAVIRNLGLPNDSERVNPNDVRGGKAWRWPSNVSMLPPGGSKMLQCWWASSRQTERISSVSVF